jgi:hypothetical protein
MDVPFSVVSCSIISFLSSVVLLSLPGCLVRNFYHHGRFRVFSFFALFFFFPGAVQCMCDASRHHQCDSSATSVNLLIADKIIDIEIIEIVTFLELVVTNTSTLP